MAKTKATTTAKPEAHPAVVMGAIMGEVLSSEAQSAVGHLVTIIGDFAKHDEVQGGITTRLYAWAKGEAGTVSTFEELCKIAEKKHKESVTGDGSKAMPQSYKNAKSVILAGFRTNRTNAAGNEENALAISETFNGLKEILAKWKKAEKKAEEDARANEAADEAKEEQSGPTIIPAAKDDVLAAFVAEVSGNSELLAAFRSQAENILANLHSIAEEHAAAALAKEAKASKRH